MELVDYPICVDPASDVISVCLRDGSTETPRTVWNHLSRLAAATVTNELPANRHNCHFFGDNTNFSQCTLVLAYCTTGSLSSIWTKPHNKRHWLPHELAEELLGQSVLKPSIRIVFNSDEEQKSFVLILDRMLTAIKQQVRPNLMDAQALVKLIARSPVPARSIPIAVMAGDGSVASVD